MRFRDALKYALKYHTLAFVPTLLALAIAVVAVWFGVGQYVANALSSAGGSPTALIEALATALLGAANPLLVVAGLVVAYFVRRVGKTALLVRTQAQAVEAARAEAAAGVSPDGSPATDVEEDDTSADDGAAESPTGISDDAEPAITENDAGEAGGDGPDDSAGDDGSDGDDEGAGGTGSGYDDTWVAADPSDDER